MLRKGCGTISYFPFLWRFPKGVAGKGRVMDCLQCVSVKCLSLLSQEVKALHWQKCSPCHSYSAFIGCVVLTASGPKLPSWFTRCSTAVHRRTLASSLTLPTFQVAEDFALSAATASNTLRFTTPLMAAEHVRLLPPRCGTVCQWRLCWHRLWRPSALDSRRFCSPSHLLTFTASDIYAAHCLQSGS